MQREKQRRGFAVLPPDQQRQIAQKGGQAAHEQGTAYEWTSEEARKAGREGGRVSAQRRRERKAAVLQRLRDLTEGPQS